MPKTNERLLQNAKAMRSEMPEPERRLWEAIRGKRLNGVKFNRQVVIGPYIVDFAARSHKLVIEVDGDTHTDAERDANRTAHLESQGYRVLRFTNHEIMTNLAGVSEAILSAIPTAPLPNPLPGGERA
ncbi:endonuclease domain-containing protein [Stakelama saccharophila]|uniref:Endonuclease domain-containing protein n=1 Tax=Stakelama saccharophila TaxID=3075605 RepID=A0ABZ0BCP6_9SPHN|nr:endonuclease domain-containing protein [Stakelama sp. W311]WNO54962.1 endonuclease domain-containing protein [Stakelama sp. W311]